MIICRELIKSCLHIRYNDSHTYVCMYIQTNVFIWEVVCIHVCVYSGAQLEAKKVRNN